MRAVPKNTRDGATIDAMADLVLRDATLCELKEVMGAIRPEGLTGVEALAVMVILRVRRNDSTRSSARGRTAA